MVLAAPMSECSDRCFTNSAKPRGSFCLKRERVGLVVRPGRTSPCLPCGCAAAVVWASFLNCSWPSRPGAGADMNDSPILVDGCPFRAGARRQPARRRLLARLDCSHAFFVAYGPAGDELAYPDASDKARKARTPADLQQLLNPESEPFPRTTKLPPLPHRPYPYNGRAPVTLGQPEPTAQQQQAPMITAPSTTQMPVPSVPAPHSTTMPLPVPTARAPSPQDGQDLAATSPVNRYRPPPESPSRRTAIHLLRLRPAIRGKMNIPLGGREH